MKLPLRLWPVLLATCLALAASSLDGASGPPHGPDISALTIDGKFDQNPKLKFRPMIECPPVLVEKKVSGEVQVEFHVVADGFVDSVKVQAAPDPYAGSCVMSAVSRMVFAPAQKDGKPVDFVGHVRVKFEPGKY